MLKTKSWGVLFALSLLFVAGRLGLYGMLMDSVAARDTSSYFACASADFTKVEAYECQRSATIPFLISILIPDQEVELTVISEPFFGSEPELAVQPGTQRLVIFQNLLSIFSWLIFTLTVVCLLRHDLSRILAAVLCYGFAFVPQLADWDSILLSESVSFSFFILMCAFLLLFLQAVFSYKSILERFIFALLLFISAAFWLFTRDTNAYFIALMALVFLVIVLIGAFWQNRFLGLTLLLSVSFAGGFVFHQITFRNSERWVVPFLNNMTGNVFSYPDRVAFFEKAGMPVSESLLTQSGSAEYNTLLQQPEFMAWARDRGLNTYTKFLIDRPLWTVQQFYFALDSFFEENIQPFFYGKPEEKPHWANRVGNFLHPLSVVVIPIDLFLLLMLAIHAQRRRSASTLTLLVFSFLLTGGGLLLTAVAYHGEVRSVWRHVLVGVMPLRLALWIMTAALVDEALETLPAAPIISRLGSPLNQAESGKILSNKTMNSPQTGTETGESA